jgi:transcriptional regulator with XRE-family HTH domain
MLKEALEQAMKERRMSTREAAKEIGVSHSTIFRIINGSTFDVPTLVAIANWLNVRPSTLLDNLGKDNDLQQIAVLFESVPGLTDVLKDAAQAVKEQKADPRIIEDILSFAAFKLSQKKG